MAVLKSRAWSYFVSLELYFVRDGIHRVTLCRHRLFSFALVYLLEKHRGPARRGGAARGDDEREQGRRVDEIRRGARDHWLVPAGARHATLLAVLHVQGRAGVRKGRCIQNGKAEKRRLRAR